MKTTTLTQALVNDTKAKAWILPNAPLFENSLENSDMFLTIYRIRNAYEELLNSLNIEEVVTNERDMILVTRLFDMAFYTPRSLSLSQMKNGKDAEVKIIEAFKDRRWKPSGKRPFEITLKLDDGSFYQINPNEILGKFFSIKSKFDSLLNSEL